MSFMYFQSILTVSMIRLRCTAFTCYAVVVSCCEWTHVFMLVDSKWILQGCVGLLLLGNEAFISVWGKVVFDIYIWGRNWMLFQDLKSSKWYSWRFRICGLWCRVDWQIVIRSLPTFQKKSPPPSLGSMLHSVIAWAMKLEEEICFELSVTIYQLTQHHILDDMYLHEML